MNTIYKYPVALKHLIEVELPIYAKILHVDFQLGTLMIWAEVDTNSPKVNRVLAVFGTGQELSAPFGKLKYISTAKQGPFVWHIYEIVNERF